jgi:glycosyltransferase involved in cell wall biosynthesis
VIPRIELQPVSHCTLKCTGCQHGIPHRGRATYQAQDFAPWLDKLEALVEWEYLVIGGGEPFLHPDLAGFIRATARGHPVSIVTNGYYLLGANWHEVAAPVFALCSLVFVSRYPIYVDRIGVAEWDRRLEVLRHDLPGVTIDRFHPENPADLLFCQHGYHHEPRPVAVPYRCCMRHCLQVLASGIVAKCPLGHWYDLIPNRTEEFVAAYGRSGFCDLRITEGRDFEEWARADAIEACSYCGIGTGDMTFTKWSNG